MSGQDVERLIDGVVDVSVAGGQPNAVVVGPVVDAGGVPQEPAEQDGVSEAAQHSAAVSGAQVQAMSLQQSAYAPS